MSWNSVRGQVGMANLLKYSTGIRAAIWAHAGVTQSHVLAEFGLFQVAQNSSISS